MRNPKLDEAHVRDLMKKLDLTREEAIRLINDDENDITTELTPEQAKVEKEMRQADRKKETTPRKRERKPDNDKRLLVSVLHGFLHDFLFASQDHLHCEMTNPEREIIFDFKGEKYQLTLVRKRKEKKS